MRVALPYYGKLIEPRHGLSHLFFIADIDLTTGKVTQMQLESKGRGFSPSFSGWLKSRSVSGVLSTDEPGHCLTGLEENGIWHRVVAGQEPEEQISDWLQSLDLPADRPDSIEANRACQSQKG